MLLFFLYLSLSRCFYCSVWCALVCACKLVCEWWKVMQMSIWLCCKDEGSTRDECVVPALRFADVVVNCEGTAVYWRRLLLMMMMLNLYIPVSSSLMIIWFSSVVSHTFKFSWVPGMSHIVHDDKNEDKKSCAYFLIQFFIRSSQMPEISCSLSVLIVK